MSIEREIKDAKMMSLSSDFKLSLNVNSLCIFFVINLLISKWWASCETLNSKVLGLSPDLPLSGFAPPLQHYRPFPYLNIKICSFSKIQVIFFLLFWKSFGGFQCTAVDE